MPRPFRFGKRKSDGQPYPKTDLSLQVQIDKLVPDKARIVKAFYKQIFEATTLERLRQLSHLVISSNLTNEEKDPLLTAIDRRYGEITTSLVGPRSFTIVARRGR